MAGDSIPVARHSKRVARDSILVTRHSNRVARDSILVTRHSKRVVRDSTRVARDLILVSHHSRCLRGALDPPPSPKIHKRISFHSPRPNFQLIVIAAITPYTHAAVQIPTRFIFAMIPST